jgi:long-chain fatty acid transport protein
VSHRTLAVTTLLSCALVAPGVSASPVDLFGFGARGQALAGALGADAEGFESVYYNPAGLAFARRPSFSLGYQSASFDLRYGIGDAALAASPTRDAPALSIGFGVPLAFGGALKDRLALGLGFTIPQTSILIADIARPGEPSFVVLENRAQTVSIQASLGVRISDAFAVGIGTIALAELAGEIAVLPNESGRIGSRVKDELVADYALVAGVVGRFLPFATGRGTRHGLSLALTYRSESRAEFDLPITADLGESFNIPIPNLTVHGIAQYDPAELSFEVAVTPVEAVAISAGITWERWSTYPLPIAYAAVPAGTPPQPLPDFNDTWAMKLGVEGTLAIGDLTLRPRAGFAFEPSPTPEQVGFHNHLDGDRMILGVGLGLRWGQFRLDLAGQVHDVAEHTSTKVEGTPTTNLGAPSITSTGHILFGSIELGVEL